MGQVWAMQLAWAAYIQAAFSRARSQRICRSAVDKDRAGDQSQDSQGARTHGAAVDPRPRRRGDRMKRRELLIVLGGGAMAAWPLVARAQQKAMPVIGILGGGSFGAFATFVAAFREG